MRCCVTDSSITSITFCCQDLVVFLSLCTRRLHNVTGRKEALQLQNQDIVLSLPPLSSALLRLSSSAPCLQTYLLLLVQGNQKHAGTHACKGVDMHTFLASK